MHLFNTRPFNFDWKYFFRKFWAISPWIGHQCVQSVTFYDNIIRILKSLSLANHELISKTYDMVKVMMQKEEGTCKNLESLVDIKFS